MGSSNLPAKAPLTLGQLLDKLQALPVAWHKYQVLVEDYRLIELADAVLVTHPFVNDLGRLRLVGFSDDSSDFLGRAVILPSYVP